MQFFLPLISMFQIVTLWRLRRRIKRLDPNGLSRLTEMDSISWLNRWLFPEWYNDLHDMHLAVILRPDIFPLEVLADDKVFKLMRRLQTSFVAHFFMFVGVSLLE